MANLRNFHDQSLTIGQTRGGLPARCCGRPTACRAGKAVGRSLVPYRAYRVEFRQGGLGARPGSGHHPATTQDDAVG